MRTVPYYACYNSLHIYLQEVKKYPKAKVSKLVAWAVQNELDRFTIGYDDFVFD